MFSTPYRKLSSGLLVAIGVLVAAMLPSSVIGRPVTAPASQAAGSTLVCTDGPLFNLETSTGFFSAPDGNQVFMWGYNVQNGAFQMPGPNLCVNQGDTVVVNLTNNLSEPVSIVFPGQSGVTAQMTSGSGNQGLFTLEANPGETVQYTFEATHPGTFLYQSGTDPHKQVQMGLYGALIVRPALDATHAGDGRKFVYNDETTEYDPEREYLLLLHEIDPVLHAKVEHGEGYTVTERHDRYWTINGRSMPDVIADNFVPWLPNQPYGALVRIEAAPQAADKLPALIRYANAGWENHPFHPHGNHMTVVGRDGRPLSQQFQNFTTTIGSGQTYDLFFEWRDVEAWDPNVPAGQLPTQITIPGQLNLVFKDGVTFYSGNPYLGEGGATTPQDSFPPGTTIFNECGEFYFPWHSHALNEVQNFDEGFGGMLTLVRVDPPNGCPTN